jgi:serine protease Do
VSRIRRDSAAYQAGIRPGDIIVSLNGQPIEDPGRFLRLLSDTAIGTSARIGLLREGRRTEISVPVTQSSGARPRR